jgi:hypothetical protein
MNISVASSTAHCASQTRPEPQAAAPAPTAAPRTVGGDGDRDTNGSKGALSTSGLEGPQLRFGQRSSAPLKPSAAPSPHARTSENLASRRPDRTVMARTFA